MAGADVRTQFEKISDSAKTANDKIKAAGKRPRTSSTPTSPAREPRRPQRPTDSARRLTPPKIKLRRGRKKSAASGRLMSPR
jgi:hypothetical protein